MILIAIGMVGGLAIAWQSGYRPPFLAERSVMSIPLVEVDRGDLVELIVENGALESANNTVVRCEVEALMGMVGGTGATGAAGAAGRTGTSGTSTQAGGTGAAAGGASTAGGAGGAGGAVATAKSKASTKSKAGTSKSASSGTSTASTSGASGASTGGSGSADASAASGATTTASAKPMIRSFSYVVAPYMPLRGATSKSTTTTAAKGMQDASAGAGRGGRGGGGGGGGRGGRGGGGMMEEEKPGSTRIVSILPEGTPVKKGQVVCELDASAFSDELKAQLIRHAQAKSWVEQARAFFEVNQITYREYKDGIFPQDLQLIRQYIQTCNIVKDQAERNMTWSREVAAKGLLTESQLKAAELTYQQATIAMEEAEGMLERLAKFTGPKNVKSLEAKIKAIESDLKNQEAALELETQRLARLQKCIDGCTIKAPDDGVLVYSQQTNGWGRVEQGIEQGVTVREGQPIFELPDPKKMRVKVKVNETKVSQIRNGQKALIKVDAFPDRPMYGSVDTVTAISTPVNGPFSDVRIYYATVNIDSGFADLRPGLTAEVQFLADARKDVNRLPLESIRPVNGKHFVALHDPRRGPDQGGAWRWTEVELGISDPDYVEVVSGVKAGDRVVANPQTLPAPDSAPTSPVGTAAPVASVSLLP